MGIPKDKTPLPARRTADKIRERGAIPGSEIQPGEHISLAEGYVSSNLDAIRLAQGADGPKYDPLYDEAAGWYEDYAKYERIIRNWSDADVEQYFGKEYNAAMKKEYQRLKDEAWEEYSKYPIVLTKETLSNPYAAKYASLLSKRTLNADERKEVQAALTQFDRLLYSGTCSDATAALADPVRCALMAKLPGYALLNEGLKEVSHDFSKPIMDIGVLNSAAESQQLRYICSDPAIVMTSPTENDYIEALMLTTKLANIAVEGGKAGLKAMGGTVQEMGKQIGKLGFDKLIEWILGQIADCMSQSIRTSMGDVEE